eukprot:3905202-Pleurochrysis_carterae.AAC.1
MVGRRAVVRLAVESPARHGVCYGGWRFGSGEPVARARNAFCRSGPAGTAAAGALVGRGTPSHAGRSHRVRKP